MQNDDGYKYTFLRHQESKYNKYGPISGYDPILTEEGKNNAKLLEGSYDYAMVSILTRTKQTFEYSRITADSIEYSSLCREKMHGKSNLLREEKNISEDHGDFRERILLLKKYLILKGEKYDRILIVTHHEVIEEITEQSVKNGHYVKLNKL